MFLNADIYFLLMLRTIYYMKFVIFYFILRELIKQHCGFTLSKVTIMLQL